MLEMKKGLILIVVVLGVGALLTLSEAAQMALHDLHHLLRTNQIRFATVFLLFYTIYIAASLRGAHVLTLAAGAVFVDLAMGTILVSIAASIGSTLAFLIGRHVREKTIRERFGTKLKQLSDGFGREGAYYLLRMRLVPTISFAVTNNLMGLTSIKTVVFFCVGLIGALPATFVYLYTGWEVWKVIGSHGLMSPGIGFYVALVLFVTFPMVIRNIVAYCEKLREK